MDFFTYMLAKKLGGGGGGGSNVNASTQRVLDALTANSININGVDWNLPEGIPEGGNEGDVLTKVIVPEELKLKDHYTADEIYEFLDGNESKGIMYMQDEYIFGLYAQERSSAVLLYVPYSSLDEMPNLYAYDPDQGTWMLESSSGSIVECDTPKLEIPNIDLSAGFTNISDINELNVLFAERTSRETLEWKPASGKSDYLMRYIRALMNMHNMDVALAEDQNGNKLEISGQCADGNITAIILQEKDN